MRSVYPLALYQVDLCDHIRLLAHLNQQEHCTYVGPPHEMSSSPL